RRKSPKTTGQVSAAAESQTVTTRSIGAAFAVANSSQDLLRSPTVAMPSAASWPSAYGLTLPAGWLPALKTSKRWPPHARSVASANTLRAELPVQRNRTRRFIGWIHVVRNGQWMRSARADRQRTGRTGFIGRIRAAVVGQVGDKPVHGIEVGAVADIAATVLAA